MASQTCALRVGDTEVYIDGSGPATIVCLHGWPDTHRLWEPTVDALSGQYRCVRFTFPGFAGPPRARAATLEELLAQLLAIVDAVSPQAPVTLLLHDWGCVFGYELARRHPARVARIAALDIGDARSPQFLAALSPGQKVMLLFYQVWLAKCWVLGRFVHAGFANFWVRLMAGWMQAPPPPQHIHWYMGFPYAMRWLGLAGGLGGLSSAMPDCPMLFLYGTRKPLMFHSPQWLAMLNARAGSRAAALAAGHWLMLDQPAAYLAELQAWLAAP